jgi:hypothetical protein
MTSSKDLLAAEPVFATLNCPQHVQESGDGYRVHEAFLNLRCLEEAVLVALLLYFSKLKTLYPFVGQ